MIISGAPHRFRSINDIHHVAKILFITDPIRRFGGEIDFGAEVRGEFAKQSHAVGWFEFVTTQQGLQRDGRFARGNMLAQSGGEMRVLPQ
jgi:hypothetical protein